MGGRSSREKGKRGERLLADELRQAFPHYASGIKRGWQSRAGSDDPDVIFPGLHLEHKNTAKPNCLGALKQAIADAKPGNIPLAVLRQARSYPVACIRWHDLLPMLVELDTFRREKDTCKPSSNETPMAPSSPSWLVKMAPTLFNP